jgi:hypothetical protein
VLFIGVLLPFLLDKAFLDGLGLGEGVFCSHGLLSYPAFFFFAVAA